MTTPIKFRGFRVDGKGWVEGSLLVMNGQSFILPDDITNFFDINDIDLSVCYISIHPSSLGMFTGRHDKNGREICGAIGEKGGDVVRFSDTDSATFFVKFKDASFNIYFLDLYAQMFLGTLNKVYESGRQDNIEIIGNQWEVENGK